MKDFKDFKDFTTISEAKQPTKQPVKVSFTHHKHGKLTGIYRGVGRMGGNTYSKVEVEGHGAFWVPHHDIKHDTE